VLSCLAGSLDLPQADMPTVIHKALRCFWVSLLAQHYIHGLGYLGSLIIPGEVESLRPVRRYSGALRYASKCSLCVGECASCGELLRGTGWSLQKGCVTENRDVSSRAASAPGRPYDTAYCLRLAPFVLSASEPRSVRKSGGIGAAVRKHREDCERKNYPQEP